MSVWLDKNEEGTLVGWDSVHVFQPRIRGAEACDNDDMMAEVCKMEATERGLCQCDDIALALETKKWHAIGFRQSTMQVCDSLRPSRFSQR